MDEKLLKTGHVPVLPTANSTESKWKLFAIKFFTDSFTVKGKVTATAEEEDEEAELRKLQAEMAM
jgi:hypothetical protein